MLPPSTVDDTVSTLGQLPIELQIRVIDLIVSFESLVVRVREHEHVLLLID